MNKHYPNCGAKADGCKRRGQIICFHRTPFPELIIANGFRDGEGLYMTTEMHRGVWLSDRPLDIGQGAKGKFLMKMEMPESVLTQYEWIEDGKPYREFLIPAEVVNSFGPPKIVDEDDYDWQDW